jgi:WD40 repeat protein
MDDFRNNFTQYVLSNNRFLNTARCRYQSRRFLMRTKLALVPAVVLCFSSHHILFAQKDAKVEQSHTQWIRQVVASADGKSLLTVGGNDPANTLRRWNLQNAKAEQVPSRFKKTWAIAASDDHRHLACCTLIDDIENPQWIVYLTTTSLDKHIPLAAIESSVVLDYPALFFSPGDQKLIALFSTKNGSTIFLCDINDTSKTPIKQETTIKEMASLARLVPSTWELAMVSDRRFVMLWDVKTGKSRGLKIGVPKGKEISVLECFRHERKILLGFDDGTIGFLDLLKHTVSSPINISDSPIISATLSTDEKQLYLGDGSGNVRIFEPKRSTVGDYCKESMPVSSLTLIQRTGKIVIASGFLDRTDVLGRTTVVDLTSRKADLIIENDQITKAFASKK